MLKEIRLNIGDIYVVVHIDSPFSNLSVLRKMIGVELLENVDPILFSICRPMVLCNRTQKAIQNLIEHMLLYIYTQTDW